jgi:putative tryptophan/tyrosine transport system substrate-binding protein
MRRREIIAGIGGAAIVWPLDSRAQQPMPVVGFVSAAAREAYKLHLAAFLEGLAETGFVEGRNVRIEYRWAEGHNERLPAMLADLVERRVSVIAATTTPAALAAKALTASIPVVFETAEDPIKTGLVSSLNRPGGKMTGVASLAGEVVQKELELLHELLPSATTFGLLIDATNPVAEETRANLRTTAQAYGLKLQILEAHSESEFDALYKDMARLKVEGLVIGSGILFADHCAQLGELAMRHRIPSVFFRRDFVEAGGILGYGGDLLDGYRLTGVQVGRVLKGAKAGDLPVIQTTKVRLIVNAKAAAALGITVPAALAGRADEVIE